MKTIYLVRHGETNDNALSLVQDGTPELSEKGKKQAISLAERVQHLAFNHLLVSDYVRTRQTVAPLLNNLTIKPDYTELVRENRRPSQFFGIRTDDADYQIYIETERANLDNPDWYFSDEENFHDMLTRVGALFAHIDTLTGNVVVYTHGRFIMYVVMYVLMGKKLTPEVWQASMHNMHTDNTGITVLKYSDKHEHWLLKTFNDHAHFAE